MSDTARIPCIKLPNVHAAMYLIGLPLLSIGDAVTYHGSHTVEHGEEFVVTGADNGRLRIMHRQYGYTMSHVRRTSVTPTGDVADMCEQCKHPIDGETCVRSDCRCRHVAAETFAEQFDAIAVGTEHVIRADDGTPVAVMLSAAEYLRLLEQVNWGKN
ncbi:hypothetical protein D5S18_24880 [Nocardia panacis]|uniref:Uncharacterized protein n=1 Tax=Nocardia panacis TaxID=2340916 RepID=A0A3A4KCN9_9NOCA|nr:hypothetical protein [Nocardia panacis]RJO71409.1 hypothetical protein D5S18_24880 [Nocardia panacis]